MDMGTAAPAFKEAGDKDLVFFEDYAADRAYPVPVSAEAVNAAADVHEAVFAAVQGREGQRAYQLSVFQFGGTYRAGLGIAGLTFGAGLELAAPVEPAVPPAACSQGGDTYTEKKGIAKPEQDDSYNHKNQNFKDILHSLVCLYGAPSI